MKLRFLILIMLLAAVTPLALPQQPQGPMTEDQVMDLVKYGMSGADLAAKIKKLSIDFDPTDEYLQSLRTAGAGDAVIQALRTARPKPLTRDQIGKLVAGGVPSQRAVTLVKQHGIDFQVDDKYLQTLQLAGADDAVIAALRAASAAAMAQLVIETSPDAEVFLDGESQGHTDPKGEVTMKTRFGEHTLKVTLAGKQNNEQNIVLDSVETRLPVLLDDIPGIVRVQTLPGAKVTLGSRIRGNADASGRLTIDDATPGANTLLVEAEGKKEFRQDIGVISGKETVVTARLIDIPKVRENPKDGLQYVWIPPGTFTMGCSPGDTKCDPYEKPPHSVTLTKGFWIGQTEVTVGAYKRFAAATGRQMPDAPKFNSDWANDALPIVNMRWDAASDYCTWAGGRLLTEAEWEYAARGGSTEALYGPVEEIAWDACTGEARPQPVGKKRANDFGLFDMLGNVWEWVSDRFDGAYANGPSQDPGGFAGSGPHVYRGGSAMNYPYDLRVSNRRWGDSITRNDDLGLRCGGDVFAP